MTSRLFALCFLFLPSVVLGGDLLPWFPRNLELRPEVTYLFQHYHAIDRGTTITTAHADDHFLTLSLGGAYDRWFAELETTFAETRRQDPGYDHFSATGRYLWGSDVVGDPLSIALGVTIIQASKGALHDISSFHHGRIEVEGHVAIGKEQVCERFWTSHCWALFALGAGDHGSPWVRFDAGWEKNHWDYCSIGTFVKTLWGLGNENLPELHDFQGYGSIDHRSADLGGRFTYSLIDWGLLSTEYSYRVYAKNFPKNAHRASIAWVIPFGL